MLSPLFLLSGQFIALLFFALLLFTLPYNEASRTQRKTESFDKAFLRIVTRGPFLLMLVLSIFFGFRVHDMWCTPFWNSRRHLGQSCVTGRCWSLKNSGALWRRGVWFSSRRCFSMRAVIFFILM